MIRKLKNLRVWMHNLIVRSWWYYQYYHNKRNVIVLGDAFIGIGSRLIPMANQYAWFGKENLSVVWTMDNWMPAKFEDLFEMTDAPGCKICSRKWRGLDRLIQIPKLPEDRIPWYQFWAPEVLCKDLPEENLRFLCDITPRWAKEHYGPFFAQLKPSRMVLKRIAACPIMDDVVCVQIRNCSVKGDASRVASPRTFIEKMRSYGPKQRFFISCMEPEISKQVHAEFGDRVIELPNKDYYSMIDAVADMWILGHTKEMICQKPSAFAEVACWWGGCKSHVIGIDWEYMQK